MIRSFLLAGVLVLAAPAFAQTQAEIDKVAEVLADGAGRFRELANSLSDEQWNFKGQGVLHTIGEEAEHIALSENDLQQIVARALGKPAEEGRAKGLAGKEDEVKTLLTDGEKLAESFRPAGKLINQGEVKEFYAAANAKLMRLLESSKELGTHLYEHPNEDFGWLTGLQWFYYIAYHRERHLLQIQTILKHPDFPGRVQTAQAR